MNNTQSTKPTGINWVANRGGKGRSNPDSFMSVSKSRGNPRPQIVVTFYTKAMRSLRWFSGDKVMVGFDDCFIYVKRSADGTHTLSPTGSDTKKSVGKPVSSNLRFSLPDGFPFTPVGFTSLDEDDVSVSEDGVLAFAYPA